MIRVLFVDDDPDMHNLLGLTLNSSQMTLVSARTGEEALAHLERHDFALIVLDLGLGEQSGMSLIPALREHAPVIILSGDSSYEARVAAVKLGVRDFLVKPVPLSEMAARITENIPGVKN